MSRDDNHGTLPEQNTPGALNDPYSRRRFLRAAVVGTAGVAGAAGVAGVALASGHGPKLLSGPLVGSVQLSNGCIPLKEGSKGSDKNSNHFLEVTNANALKVHVGECIILTALAGGVGLGPPFKTTIISIAPKAGTPTHTLLCICPPIPNNPPNDHYPEQSTICPSTDCPAETGCISCTQ